MDIQKIKANIAARKALGMTSAEYHAHLKTEARKAGARHLNHHFNHTDEDREMLEALRTDNFAAIKSILDRQS